MDTAIRARLDQHVITNKTVVYRSIPGGTLEATPKWVRGYSGLQSPIFNVYLPLTPAALADDELADTSAFFSSRNAHYVVELMHDRFPEGPEYLNQRHYQPLPPQLAMALAGRHDEVPLNFDIIIERVTTVPALTAFCAILNSVFDFPLKELTKFYPARHFEEKRIQHYLAFVNEQPVGAGTVICADGVASIWNVCTLDSFRQRGVATTLVQRMLVDAGERGADLIMLFSTAHAFTLFNKFGFDIYTQCQWFLPPGIDYYEE